MDRSLVRISKFLSLVLRHDPGRAGITLDPAGWADVEELLAGAEKAGLRIDRAVLTRVVTENEKQRFAFSPDAKKIRANQGHSVPIDLGLVALHPPERLYHGTASRFLASIRKEGLRAGTRLHVHLSSDEQTARQVGQRHGSPVVLPVASGQMQHDGFVFFRSENGVWLTDSVPPRYIQFPA